RRAGRDARLRRAAARGRVAHRAGDRRRPRSGPRAGDRRARRSHLRGRAAARDPRGSIPQSAGEATRMRGLVIARLVIREAARRRLLLALLVLTLIVIALTGWGFSRIPTITQRGAPLPDVQVKLVASQFLIVTMFMFSFVLAMAAVFVAAPQISGDV